MIRLFVAILSGLVALGNPVSPHLPVCGRQAVHAAVAPMKTPDPQDISIFQQKIPVARSEQTLAAQTLAIAKSFLGTPYVSGTLESTQREQLTLNLRELDCWTFVENSLAIALAAQTTQPNIDTLAYFVRQLRYWGGTINGYASRMHYFSGWLLQAEKLGYLHDLSHELGGVPYRINIGYMSARPDKYPALKNPETRKQIQQIEQRLSTHPWYYIPQDQIEKKEPLLRNGDLIALTSWKKDLDIAHQGFAVCQNGRVYLLHASSLGKRVLISRQPLAEYVRSQKGQTGIMVARLN